MLFYDSGHMSPLPGASPGSCPLLGPAKLGEELFWCTFLFTAYSTSPLNYHIRL